MGGYTSWSDEKLSAELERVEKIPCVPGSPKAAERSRAVENIRAEFKARAGAKRGREAAEETALNAKLDSWRMGKLVARRYLPRMGAAIAVNRMDGGWFAVHRAFMLGGEPQLSVDLETGTPEQAFAKLMEVLF